MSEIVRLARIGIRAFDLPLARPLRVGGKTIDRRTGLLVVAEDGEGHAGIGEAAPLPGLHRESLAEATGQLFVLAGALAGAAIPAGCPALDGAFEGWLGGRGLLPSVRTGIEGAVLALLADRAGCGVPRLLSPAAASRIRVNALLDGPPEALLAAAARFAAAGYAALKVKVGRRDPRDEARLVAQIRAAVGPGIALRLDANRAWEFAQALDFAERVAPVGVEYLEEPLRDPADLPAFAARARVAVALDETLLAFEPQAPPRLAGVAALILKPSVLGGYERAMVWARVARRERLAAVVSAAFPSAVGLALDAALAAAIDDGTAHGLGTAGLLAADLIRAPLADASGAIDTAALPFRPADFDLGSTRVLR